MKRDSFSDGGNFLWNSRKDEGICSGAQIVHHYYVCKPLWKKNRKRKKKRDKRDGIIKQVFTPKQSIAAATWNMGN